jgi:hypothetical protein
MFMAPGTYDPYLVFVNERQMRTGSLGLTAREGQWSFGLALIEQREHRTLATPEKSNILGTLVRPTKNVSLL